MAVQDMITISKGALGEEGMRRSMALLRFLSPPLFFIPKKPNLEFTITSCNRHRPEHLRTEAMREHNEITCSGCIILDISWKWGPCTSQHLVFCRYFKTENATIYIKLQVAYQIKCPINSRNSMPETHAASIVLSNCFCLKQLQGLL